MIDAIVKLGDALLQTPGGLLVFLIFGGIGAGIWVLRMVMNYVQASSDRCHASHAKISQDATEALKSQTKVVTAALDRSSDSNGELAKIVARNTEILGEVGAHLKSCAETQSALERSIRERATAHAVTNIQPPSPPSDPGAGSQT